MKKIAFLIIFLIAISFSFNISDSSLVNSAKIEIVEDGAIIAKKGKIEQLTIYIPVPAKTDYQKTESSDQILSDKDGNNFILINVSNPQNPFYFYKRFLVYTQSRKTNFLNSSFYLDPSIREFLKPTSKYQSYNPIIKDLAEEIVANSSSNFEKVAKLAIFVNNYINYNISFAGKEKDALWIIENRQGVCTEFTTLFIALARAAGFAARPISGYVYSNNTWAAHSWAEVYLGEWIPVDPTWLEVGYLDALHIELSKEEENKFSYSYTSYDKNINVVFNSSKNDGLYLKNIYVINFTKDDPIEFSVFYSSQNISENSPVLLFLSAKGKDYKVVPVEVLSCIDENSKPLLSVSPSKQNLILEPGKNSTAVWLIIQNKQTDPNYIYRCPITIYSPYFNLTTHEIVLNSEIKSLKKFYAVVKDKVSSPQKNNTIIINSFSSLIGKKAYVILPDGIYSYVINSNPQELNFSSQKEGEITLYLAVEDSGFQKLQYTSKINRSVSIINYSIPHSIFLEKPSEVLLKIKANEYPARFNLVVSFGTQNVSSFFEINSQEEVKVNIIPKKAGLQNFEITIFSEDGKIIDKKEDFILVLEQPNVFLKSVKTLVDPYGQKTILYFDFTGQPIKPVVTIAGINYALSNNITLRIEPGRYNAEIKWEDVAGNKYTKFANFEIENKTQTSLFVPSDKKSNLVCLPSFVFLFLFAFYLSRKVIK